MKKRDVKLISASAGSGKTYRLMEIVCEEVGAGLKARGLIAVTYTKKAAEELKQRIREKLVESGQIETARSMAASRIGTVHSICADLLKRFAFEDGSSPRQRVIDEIEANRLFEASLNETLKPEHLRDLAGLANKLSMGIGDLVGKVRSIASLARQNDMNEGAMRESIQISIAQIDQVLLPPLASSTLQGLAAELKDFTTKYPDPPDTKKNTAEAHKMVFDLKSKIVDQKRNLPWAEWVRLTKLSPSVKTSDLYAGIIDKAKGFMSNPDLRADLRATIEILFGLAQLAMVSYAQKKQNLGVLDYADLEQKTLHLLNRKEIQEQLASEIDVLLVDEFQDTNPVQLAIFLKLSELCRKTVWVGDLKQSIYRFRGADPILMKSIMDGLDDPNPEILKDNWRSRPEIVAFASDLFSLAFSVDGIPKEQVTQTSKWRHALDGPAIEVWEATGKNKGERALKFCHGVYAYLATGKMIVDRDTEKQRKIRPGDVAILCRSNDECLDISKALNELGLESSVAGGALLEQPEVALALAAYRFLMNSRDTLAAAELTLGLGSDPNGWLGQALDGADPTSWHSALQRLSIAREQTTEMSIREKLDLAIALVPLESWVERLEEGEKRLFHLSALRQEAQKYESSCHAAFDPCTDLGFLEFLEEVEPGLPSSAHPDAIHITTYHSSKGLEWPVVILASLEQSPHEASLFGLRVEMKDKARFDPTEPLKNRIIAYLEWPFGGFSSVPELDQRLASAPKMPVLHKESQAELRRVLYVGMTRAREHLILLNNLGKTPIEETVMGALGGKDGKCLLQFPTTDNKIKVGTHSHACLRRELALPKDTDHESGDEADSVPTPKTLMTPVGSPKPGPYQPLYLQPSKLNIAHAPTLSFQVEAGRLSNWGEALLLKNRGALDSANDGEEESSKDVIGTAVHLFLGSDLYGEPHVKRLAHATSIINDWAISSAVRAVDLLGASDRFRSAVEGLWPGAKIYREVPMEFELHGSLVRGSVDCLIDAGTELIIVDHKTTSATAPQAIETAGRYRFQLSAYAEAARRAYPDRKISVWLHNPDGWMLEVTLKPESTQAA